MICVARGAGEMAGHYYYTDPQGQSHWQPPVTSAASATFVPQLTSNDSELEPDNEAPTLFTRFTRRVAQRARSGSLD